MSEPRVAMRRGKPVQVEGFTCAECGVWVPRGEVHTDMVCELHKLGWSRERIISNVEFTARLLNQAAAERHFGGAGRG